MNKKLILIGLAQAAGVLAYVAAISWIITNGEYLFGKMPTVWGPILMLLLLVFSAAVTGSLVFAKPVILYLQDRKVEGLGLLFLTLSFLLIFIVGIIVFLLLRGV